MQLHLALVSLSKPYDLTYLWPFVFPFLWGQYQYRTKDIKLCTYDPKHAQHAIPCTLTPFALSYLKSIYKIKWLYRAQNHRYNDFTVDPVGFPQKYEFLVVNYPTYGRWVVRKTDAKIDLQTHVNLGLQRHNSSSWIWISDSGTGWVAWRIKRLTPTGSMCVWCPEHAKPNPLNLAASFQFPPPS